MNERIRTSQVRLIAEDGTQAGVVSIEDALNKARDAGLDLVEVAPEAAPPVCRILDYGKFKYQLQKKKHGAHHHAPTIKEIRLRVRTEKHDLEVKAKKAKEFIERKDRVVVSMNLWGRERAHPDLAIGVMREFVALVGEAAKIESEPRMEGRRCVMILAPLK
ncbi:MAG TPA: translation initiation factor IF-3 [Candidatus Brocadiia bacterium]|nr:translation initiation factor IF-3 [Candidatus Brocadiia bacterium]